MVGDDVGPRLTVGGDDTVGDSEGDNDTVGSNDTVGGDEGDDTVGDSVGPRLTVGGDVLAIRGSEHSPHSEHTSLA